MGEHDGHRERIRERFDENTHRRRTDEELLELLLCCALPRRDVMPLVRLLLEKYGDLGGLIGRPVEELLEIRGIGQSTAVLIALAGEASKRSEEQRRRGSVLNTPAAVREYIRTRLRFTQGEVSYAICLDESMCPVSCDVISGDLSDLVSRILRLAAKSGTKTVVVAAGTREDMPSLNLPLVRELNDSLGGLGIALLDYIRIHDEFYASAAELGELRGSEPSRARYHAPLAGFTRTLPRFKAEWVY